MHALSKAGNDVFKPVTLPEVVIHSLEHGAITPGNDQTLGRVLFASAPALGWQIFCQRFPAA